mgnify:CR=1 FL=1
MKKYFIIICCIILLTGCESKKDNIIPNKETKVNVTDNYGENIEISAKELCGIYINDSNEYNEKYLGSKVSFTGRINRIETGFTIDNGDTIYSEITFREGFIITFKKDDNIEDLNLGDTLTIEGNIGSAENCNFSSNIMVENVQFKK